MGPKTGLLGSGHSVRTELLGEMLATDSGMAVAAHSIDSSAVRVATLGHSAFASGIATGASGTEGAAAALASVTDSSTGARRTG
jgi:hypothetical protein